MRVSPHELKKCQVLIKHTEVLNSRGTFHYAKNSEKVVMTLMIKRFGSVEDFSRSFSISEQCCSSHLVVRLISDRSPDLLYGHLSTTATFSLRTVQTLTLV